MLDFSRFTLLSFEASGSAASFRWVLPIAASRLSWNWSSLDVISFLAVSCMKEMGSSACTVTFRFSDSFCWRKKKNENAVGLLWGCRVTCSAAAPPAWRISTEKIHRIVSRRLCVQLTRKRAISKNLDIHTSIMLLKFSTLLHSLQWNIKAKTKKKI